MQIEDEQKQQIEQQNLVQNSYPQKESINKIDWKKVINQRFNHNIHLDAESFIKKIVHRSDNPSKDSLTASSERLMLLGQNNAITIIEPLSEYQKDQYDQIRIQTVLYDAKFLNQPSQSIIVSCKNMPLRIFKRQDMTFIRTQKCQHSNFQCVGSFSQKKPNSETYLSPIQLQIDDSNSDFCFGVGQKFMHLYDLNTLKLVTDFTVKNDKTTIYRTRHFSTAKILNVFQNQKLAIVGQFNGTLSLIDLKYKDSQNKKVFIQSLPNLHMDSINHIQTNKSSQNYLLTAARKDDFRYLWDLRNLNTFVQCYHQPLFGNQRVGLQSEGQLLYAGNQFGEIVVFDLLSGKQINRIDPLKQQTISKQARKDKSTTEVNKNEQQIKTNNFQKCIGSIAKAKDGLFCAIGGPEDTQDIQQKMEFQPTIKYLNYEN